MTTAALPDLVARLRVDTTDLTRAQKSTGAFGKNVGRLIGTAAIVGFGKASMDASRTFGQAMANIATLIPGNTARVEELTTAVKDMGPRTGKSLEDLSDGLYNVISAFGDSADSTAILELNAKAATAGLATTTDAINLTSAVTKGYGDTSAEAVEKAADLALLTVRMGQTTFPELAASIGKVIPVAQNLGVTQEETFAIMATFTGVTGGAAEVSTQLRGAMQGLMAPTKDAAKAIADAGYESGAALVEAEGLDGALGLLSKAAKDSGKPLANYIGSIEGQTIALGLAGAQSGDYKAKLGELQGAQGTTEEAFNAATTGAGAQAFEYAQLQAKAEKLRVEVGDRLGPKVLALTGFASDNAGAILRVAGAVAAAYAAVKVYRATVVAVNLVTALHTLLTKRQAQANVTAATTQHGLNTAMRLNPIGLVVTAIAALAAGLIYAYKNSETFRNIVSAAFSTIKQAGSLMAIFVIQSFKGILNIWLLVAEGIVKAAAKAFSWVPGLGGKLKTAETAITGFKKNANAQLDAVTNKITVDADTSKAKRSIDDIVKYVGKANGTMSVNVRQIGDGPGRPSGGGGNVANRIRPVLDRLGGYVTSTYRTPEQNRRVGGSPRSYHTDRNNPAVDIGGPTVVLDRVAAALRSMGGWRELLWRTAGHYDHVHVAHQGGRVGSDWYRSPGDGPDERTARLQVGETVIPKGGGIVAPAPTVHVYIGNEEVTSRVRVVVDRALDGVAREARFGVVGG